eukprot:14935029-Alexandrium_andersonii.AAC.1
MGPAEDARLAATSTTAHAALSRAALWGERAHSGTRGTLPPCPARQRAAPSPGPRPGLVP